MKDVDTTLAMYLAQKMRIFKVVVVVVVLVELGLLVQNLFGVVAVVVEVMVMLAAQVLMVELEVLAVLLQMV